MVSLSNGFKPFIREKNAVIDVFLEFFISLRIIEIGELKSCRIHDVIIQVLGEFMSFIGGHNGERDCRFRKSCRKSCRFAWGASLK